MAVQTTEEFKNGGSTTYSTTIEYLKPADIIVRIDGALQTYVTGTPSSGEYKVSGTTVTLGAAATAGSGNVHIYRETNVDTPAAVFAPGSSIRAADLNAIHDMARFSAVEHRNKIIQANINPGQVTSTEIKDDTIVNADINASADIANSKIADGLLKSGITINSSNIVDGSIVDADVNASANIQGSKLADDSVALDKLGGGPLPSDIVVTRDNIQDGTIQSADIETGTLDNRYYTETELNNGQLNTIYYTEQELDAGQLDNRYFTEAELNAGILDTRYYNETELNNGQLNNVYYNQASLDGGQLDNRYFTEAELTGGSLDGRYYTETEILGGAADGRYYTETELDAGQLDNRYYTETELNAGQLDNRYYTETEAEALFLRQDSSETIASGVSWSAADDKVATTAAIDARIIDLVDDVGGFVPIQNEASFPATNPDVNNGAGTLISVRTAAAALTPTSGTVTIPNGAGSGNTVTITGVTATIPQGFGFIVETTTTTHTYSFHRLVPKATQVTTVANAIAQVIACGNNLLDIENFADLYQIGTSAPTTRADGGSLTVGDLWFDSSSNQVMMVYDGSAGDGFSPITPSQSTITAINSVSGHITYQEDLGLITEAVNTGSGNNSINTVGANIAAVNTVAADLNETTSEIDTVANSITNVNNVGNSIANVNAVAANETNINAVKNNATNINAAVANASNINSAVSNASNITTVAGISSNVTTVANNTSNINAAVSNQSNINSAVSNATNINTVAGSIADVNRYANEYKIQTGTPSGPSAGDLWFNTTANLLNYYTGSTWVGISPGIAGLINDANPALANHLDCNDKNLTEVGTVSGNNLQIDFGTL